MATVSSQPSLLISMQNGCDEGTPVFNNNTFSTNVTLASGATSFTSTGPLISNIYYDNGGCGPDGTNCSNVILNFFGGVATAAIGITTPYGFNVPVGFNFIGGSCDGGIFCTSLDCENFAVQCTPDEETQLAIYFCEDPLMTSNYTLPPLPSPTSITTLSTHASRPIAAIAGGVVGGIIMIAVLILILFLLKRRKQSPSAKPLEKYEFQDRPAYQPDQKISRSSSPAGWSVNNERPMTVDYSDTTMQFKVLPDAEKI